MILPFPTKFLIPDLFSHCPFPLRTNRHRASTTTASKSWLFRGLAGFPFLPASDPPSLKRIFKAFHGLKAGKLTAMCYPTAGAPQLRVCCDFMNYLFHLDNISDDMDTRGTRNTADIVMETLRQPSGHPGSYTGSSADTRLTKMTREQVIIYVLHLPFIYWLSRSFWTRLSRTASPGARRRFISTFELFFDAVARQAQDRSTTTVPDLESYIAMRRDTSGCKPCWALIEYANNLDLPDDVMEHPLIASLGEAANDLVTWSNVRFYFFLSQFSSLIHM